VATDDGRYVVRNGRLIVTVSHKGQEIQEAVDGPGCSPRDFVLKLEFRASPNADSGVFVREPQLQCRDFIIAGPFSTLANYRPLDWNEIVVTVRGGLAHCTCNGEVIMDAMPVPATGPSGLRATAGRWSTAGSGWRRRAEGRPAPAAGPASATRRACPSQGHFKGRDAVRWGIIGCGDVTEVKSGPGFRRRPAPSSWRSCAATAPSRRTTPGATACRAGTTAPRR
jgi:hypothetical protein